MILLYGVQKLSWLLSAEALVLVTAVFLLAYIRANDLAKGIRYFSMGIIAFMLGLMLCTVFTCGSCHQKRGCEKAYAGCSAHEGKAGCEARSGCQKKHDKGCSRSHGETKACCKKKEGKSCDKWKKSHGDWDGKKYWREKESESEEKPKSETEPAVN
ncbi:MAG: hypothetical protein HRT71_13795 [Flavobacteriales bacterium]|nr:hypothetical protein [Flavobacteriales bacterium]